MKQYIWLRDIPEVPHKGNPDYSVAELAQARAEQAALGLRFNNRTGVTRRDDVCELERYSNQSDFQPHQSVESVMRWEFSRHINNAAHHIRSRKTNTDL